VAKAEWKRLDFSQQPVYCINAYTNKIIGHISFRLTINAGVKYANVVVMHLTHSPRIGRLWL